MAYRMLISNSLPAFHQNLSVRVAEVTSHTLAGTNCRGRSHGGFARRHRDRAGAYTVEFAICASLLFGLVFGLFEFSRFLFVRQAIDQAAYEAARIGIVPGAQNSEIRTRAESLLSAAGVLNTDITIRPDLISESTREVTVEIRCNFGDNSFIPGVFLGNQEIVGRSTLDHENQAFLIPEDAAAAAELNENDEPDDV